MVSSTLQFSQSVICPAFWLKYTRHKRYPVQLLPRTSALIYLTGHFILKASSRKTGIVKGEQALWLKYFFLNSYITGFMFDSRFSLKRANNIGHMIMYFQVVPRTVKSQFWHYHLFPLLYKTHFSSTYDNQDKLIQCFIFPNNTEKRFCFSGSLFLDIFSHLQHMHLSQKHFLWKAEKLF